MHSLRHYLFVLAALVAVAGDAAAAAIFETVQGEVKVSDGKGPAQAAEPGRRVNAGSTVQTTAGSRGLLKFDDGHRVLLASNTEFRINEYNYVPDQPSTGKMVLSLLRGALRSVTGLLADRNHSAFALRTPVATIGIRGTDLSVSLTDGAYLKVDAGAANAVNTGGLIDVNTGQIANIANESTKGILVPQSAVPPGTFGELQTMSLGSATGSTGEVAAGGGVSGGAAAAIGAAVAAGAALSGGGGDGTTTHHSTTTHH
ncbi:MAG: FecR domain-containing protein [Rhodocyclaceae bacterium]|nr:FecR domain-containing protein [Rhodocyclaceae bacterium]